MNAVALLVKIGKVFTKKRDLYVECTGCHVTNLISTEPREGWVCGACGRHLPTVQLS